MTERNGQFVHWSSDLDQQKVNGARDKAMNIIHKAYRFRIKYSVSPRHITVPFIGAEAPSGHVARPEQSHLLPEACSPNVKNVNVN